MDNDSRLTQYERDALARAQAAGAKVDIRPDGSVDIQYETSVPRALQLFLDRGLMVLLTTVDPQQDSTPPQWIDKPFRATAFKFPWNPLEMKTIGAGATLQEALVDLCEGVGDIDKIGTVPEDSGGPLDAYAPYIV